ncbi:hypothetical protein L7F22_026904 [Adiantum nelumboides]|nr:hypothetical protein [Adiantum nelumboides]
MADVFGVPELVEMVYPKAFQQPQLHHLHHKDETPHSQSAESLNEGEPELESDAEEPLLNPSSTLIDPEPYVSTQFYTFNSASHHLMVQCIMQSRYASPREIREATPPSVLQSWRGVWKDRNEDTAYITGWKRIQDKLNAQVDSDGHEMLFFKNSPHQFIPHINQWQDIIFGFHGDADLQHLGVKDTIDRIKQVWTVGAKLYGIPEAYIKVCIASCPVCCSSDMASHQKQSSKRHRFEYTESFEVHAKEVPQRLQQLAAKHQVVLCIRQKYIRFKPFLAEVKDYCCHRAGEPNLKKPGVLKRKRYSSKRCGCGFRIRAIVPITNYSEKEKTFSYQEEGQAIFKLFAVHSGHEPGPHEGSARIMHRLVGSSGMHMDIITPMVQDEESSIIQYAKDDLDAREVIMQQVHELCVELQMLDGKLGSLSQDTLNNLSQDLAAMTHRIKNIEEFQETHGMLVSKTDANDLILNHPELETWAGGRGRNKEEAIVGDHLDPDYDSALGPETHWDRQKVELPSEGRACSLQGSCPQFHDDGISGDRDSESCNPDIKQVVSIENDATLVNMPVDNYYQENVKWYEGVSCGLDPSADDLSHSVSTGFRHSIV